MVHLLEDIDDNKIMRHSYTLSIPFKGREKGPAEKIKNAGQELLTGAQRKELKQNDVRASSDVRRQFMPPYEWRPDSTRFTPRYVKITARKPTDEITAIWVPFHPRT